MDSEVKDLKNTTHPHWQALPSQAVQRELMRLDSSYQDFFDKKGGKPKRKPRHKFKSITFPGTSGWKIDEDYMPEHIGRIRITLREWSDQKQKWVRKPVWFSFFKHRHYYGNICTITIKRDKCGDYWLCITTDFIDSKPMPATGENVGADFGLKDAFLTLNTSEKIQSPQYLKQALAKLRYLNKSLSRKIKGSGNWWRIVRAIARLYSRITNQRLDWHWKTAHDLCKRFDNICIEDLNLRGMQRLWGRKISDVSFGQFVRILEYKCSKHSRQLLKAGRWTATTKPCSECGYKNKTLTLADRSWICPECSTQHDRDINAAKNILQACLGASVEQT